MGAGAGAGAGAGGITGRGGKRGGRAGAGAGAGAGGAAAAPPAAAGVARALPVKVGADIPAPDVRTSPRWRSCSAADTVGSGAGAGACCGAASMDAIMSAVDTDAAGRGGRGGGAPALPNADAVDADTGSSSSSLELANRFLLMVAFVRDQWQTASERQDRRAAWRNPHDASMAPKDPPMAEADRRPLRRRISYAKW